MIGNILELITKFIPDTDKAKELETQLNKEFEKTLRSAVEADKEIRLAEMKSDNWLQSRWRPIAALIVFFTFFVRFPLYFILQLIVNIFEINVYIPILEDLPADFYLIGTAFVSIYAYGRSQEKRFK